MISLVKVLMFFLLSYIRHKTRVILLFVLLLLSSVRGRPQSTARLCLCCSQTPGSRMILGENQWHDLSSVPNWTTTASCLSCKLTLTSWRTNAQQEITFSLNSFIYEMIPGFFWPQWRSCHLTPSTFCSNPLALWVSCTVCVWTFRQRNKSGGTLLVPH